MTAILAQGREQVKKMTKFKMLKNCVKNYTEDYEQKQMDISKPF